MSRLLERRLARWQAQLAAGRPVELRLRWWLAWPLVLLSLAMAGVAGWLLVLHSESAGESVLLSLLVLVLGVSGLAQLWALVRRRGPAVVIDRDGVHLPWIELDAPWRVVRGAGVRRVRLVPILYLEVQPAFKKAWLERRRAGRLQRAAHQGDDTVGLPFPLAADADHVAALITRLARHGLGSRT